MSVKKLHAETSHALRIAHCGLRRGSRSALPRVGTLDGRGVLPTHLLTARKDASCTDKKREELLIINYSLLSMTIVLNN